MIFDPSHAKLKAELDNLLEQVLDEAMIPHRDMQSEESFQECAICGEWDGHVNHCPIPAIDKYINSNITDKGEIIT